MGPGRGWAAIGVLLNCFLTQSAAKNGAAEGAVGSGRGWAAMWGAIKLLVNTKNGAAEGVVGPGRGWAAIGALLNYFLIPPKTSPKRLNRQPKMVLRRARWDQGGVGQPFWVLLNYLLIPKMVGKS